MPWKYLIKRIIRYIASTGIIEYNDVIKHISKKYKASKIQVNMALYEVPNIEYLSNGKIRLK